ncbi:uncharacterized protein LOC128558269 [Mercenaria mercenaria]|uniref:uncharacterized protein LOC128558269 n=1 Tax=Mercenaria mercenaria TaxID=6596 RepID=UPI00234F8351|nr:uncharacterized protein LOC128558269 [Mercenaria mercenaria]
MVQYGTISCLYIFTCRYKPYFSHGSLHGQWSHDSLPGQWSQGSLPGIACTVVYPVKCRKTVCQGNAGTVVYLGNGRKVILSDNSCTVIYQGNAGTVSYPSNGRKVVFTDNACTVIYQGNAGTVSYPGNGREVVFTDNACTVIYQGNAGTVSYPGNGREVVFTDNACTVIYQGNAGTVSYPGNGRKVVFTDNACTVIYQGNAGTVSYPDNGRKRSCRCISELGIFERKNTLGYFTTVIYLLTRLNQGLCDDGYFWHVTDFHYDPTYETTSLSCKESKVGDQIGTFGDMWCDSPWILIESCVQAMKKFKRNVDFVLWTGDTILHADVEKLNHTFNAVILDNTTDVLKAAFPDIPVYATFGNHDAYPTGQFPPNNTLLYNESLARWRSWINDDTQDEDFRNGGFYTVKTSHGIRIVALNTNFYYTPNKLVSPEGDPAGQFAWLTETLGNANEQNEKVSYDLNMLS